MHHQKGDVTISMSLPCHSTQYGQQIEHQIVQSIAQEIRLASKKGLYGTVCTAGTIRHKRGTGVPVCQTYHKMHLKHYCNGKKHQMRQRHKSCFRHKMHQRHKMCLRHKMRQSTRCVRAHVAKRHNVHQRHKLN